MLIFKILKSYENFELEKKIIWKFYEMTNQQNSDGASVIFRFGKVRLGRVLLQQRVLLWQRVLL